MAGLLLFPFVVESLFKLLGIYDSSYAHLILAHLYGFLAIAAQPVALLAYIAAPALIALRRHRRFWPWALGGLILGPFALAVLALPPGTPRVRALGADSRTCPSCGEAYLVSDFRHDADRWSCGRCKRELPKEHVVTAE